MIKSIIIDDQESYRRKLRRIIESKLADKLYVAGEASSMTEGIAMIKKVSPELVFLDIEMPGGSGFDLLEQIGKINFDVIFTTAHSEHGIRAIKFSALDYLLKPIDADELIAAVAKHSDKKQTKDTNKEVEFILKNIRSIEGIGLPTTTGYEFVKRNDIIRCQGDVNYTDVFMKGGSSIKVSRTLKEVESHLTDHFFFRVHDSHLVNLNHIRKYVKGDGGYLLLHETKGEIPVSRGKKEGLLTRLNELGGLF